MTSWHWRWSTVLGRLSIGDAAIIAVVSAGHQAAIFAACADLVNEVKARVPIWKHHLLRARDPRMGELPVTPAHLTGELGHRHRDLQVSLTDRSSLRCACYMPKQFGVWILVHLLLTPDEVVEVVSIAMSCGNQTVRPTGGEPLLESHVFDIVRWVAGLLDAPMISKTSNGLRLPQLPKPQMRAGGRDAMESW